MDQDSIFSELLVNLEEVKDKEDNIIDSIDKLNENEKVENEKNDKETAVIKDDVKTILSTKEKTRIKNIGQYFTEGAMKVINNFLKKRDKESAMHIEATAKNKKGGWFFDLLGSGVNKVASTVKNKSWWSKLLKAVGVLGLVAFAFRDKVDVFFKNLWGNVEPIFDKLVDNIKLFFLGGIDVFIKMFGDFFGDKDLKKAFTDSMHALANALKKISNIISTILKGGFNISEFVPDLVKGLVKIMTKILSPFSLIGIVIEEIKEGLQQVFDWFKSEKKLYGVRRYEGRNVSGDLRSAKLSKEDMEIIKGGVLEEESKKRIKTLQYFRESNEQLLKSLSTIEDSYSYSQQALLAYNKIINQIKSGELKTPEDIKKATMNLRVDLSKWVPEEFMPVMDGLFAQLDFNADNMSAEDFKKYVDQVKRTIVNATTQGLKKNYQGAINELIQGITWDNNQNEAEYRKKINEILEKDPRFRNLSAEIKELYKEALNNTNVNDLEAVLNDNERMREFKDLDRKKRSYEVLLDVFNKKIEVWADNFKKTLPTVFGEGFINALGDKLKDVKFENKTVENRSENIQNMIVVHKFKMDSIESSMANLAKSQEGQLNEMTKQTSVMSQLKDVISNMKKDIVTVVQGNKEEAATRVSPPMRPAGAN